MIKSLDALVLVFTCTIFSTALAWSPVTRHDCARKSLSCSSSMTAVQLWMAKDKNGNSDETWMEDSPKSTSRRDLIYNGVAVGLLGASGASAYSLFKTSVYTPQDFTRLPNIQFIAALGDPTANSGKGANEWGLWTLDPGPRGVWLKDYQKSFSAPTSFQAPSGWTFDPNDWWLEEHGLIMEQPQFPLAPGRYLVTGGRMVTTGLTIANDGSWKLDDASASLYDVTHLPCRSARYTPIASADGGTGSPLTANPRDFPVTPGAIMPSVPGCNKQDYAVLFVVGKARTS